MRTGREVVDMVRILHTADWQIGMTRRFLQGEAQARFAAARVEAIRSCGRVARDEGCDAVVVCGDVFESNSLTPQTVRRALEALRSVPVPVYLLPGNHDPLDAASVFTSELFRAEVPAHVHVLDSVGPHRVGPGLELVAAPWTSKHPGRDLVAEALATVPEGPAPVGLVRVVVGHGAVDELDPDRRSRATIDTTGLRAALDQGRIHYVALGDRHSRTPVAGTEAIHYSGAPEPTSERETDPGQVLVVDVDPERAEPVQVVAHQVGTWAFRVLERRVDGVADLAALDAELDAVPAAERTVVVLTLAGTLNVPEHAALESLRARHRDRLAALVERAGDRGVAVVSQDLDWADRGVAGFLASAVGQIQDQARQPALPREGFVPGRPDDEGSARDALALLYRLTEGSRR